MTEDSRSVLLVDFGGVLTTSVHDALRAFSADIGGDPELVLRLLASDAKSAKLLVESETGRLDDEDFERGFAARLAAYGVHVPADGLLARMQTGGSADHEMLDALARMRAGGVPIAIVTNQLGRDCYDGFDLEALADVVVISAEVGVRKPSRRVYAIACERLGVPPETCVMVDDLRHNLDGAARLGIAGVLHTTAARTVRELDQRFGIR
jgi:putative hydrolase of the HAD superfamily